MFRPLRRRWRTAIAATLIVPFLVSCGGGGGATDPGSSGGGSASASGLLPAAPTAGAQLVDDSSAYRPLVAGGGWTYRQFVALVGPTEPRVSQAATAGGRLLESSTDGAEGDAELWREADGSTWTSTDLVLAPSATITVSGMELPRILKADMQFTVADRRITDVGADLDGDGGRDGLDLAVWRRVVGFEDLRIPASTQPVRALRIDDWVAVRVRPGDGSAPGPTIQARGSTWYVEGVGIARTVSWTTVDANEADSDVRLVGFDGGDRGFGVVRYPQSIAPVGQVIALADGVIVENAGAAGGPIFKLDRNGQLVSAAGSAERDGESVAWRQLLPTASGLRVASRVFDAPNDVTNIDALDASARLVGARLGTLRIDATDPSVNANGAMQLLSDAGSPVIWMAFIDRRTVSPGNVQDALVLRRFDAAAQPLGEAIRIEPATSTSLELLHAVATPDGVFAVLQEFDPMAGSPVRLVAVGNDGTVTANRLQVLGPFGPTVAWVQADGAGGRWLLWWPTTLDSDPMPHGIRLAADGAPVGIADSPEAISAALVSPLPDALNVNWKPGGIGAAAGEWWMTGSAVGSLDDGASAPAEHPVIARIAPGDGSLTGGLVVDLLDLSGGGLASTPVAFDDRVLFWVAGKPVVLWRTPASR